MSVSTRLKLARKALHLTLSEVQIKTGVGTSTLSDFESAKREPRLAQLVQLAKVYDRPLTFFLSDQPVSHEVVLWREKPKSPAAEQIQLRLLNLAEQYHHLEAWCDEHQPIRLPSVTAPNAASFRYPDAQQLAHDIRQQLALGERPGQTLLRVLEEVCQVKVFHLDFEPTGSAACTFSPQFGAAVLLNSRHVRWRRNFDLAHELFHLVTWNVFRTEQTGTAVEASAQEEKFATCFARHLLMPREVLRLVVDARRAKNKDHLSFEDLFEVARQFDVSVEALLWHISLEYKIPETEVRNSLKAFRNQMSFWDDRERDIPPERPMRYQALARKALRLGKLSTGRYAEYVGISRREAMRIAEQSDKQDAEVEVVDS